VKRWCGREHKRKRKAEKERKVSYYYGTAIERKRKNTHVNTADGADQPLWACLAEVGVNKPTRRLWACCFNCKIFPGPFRLATLGLSGPSKIGILPLGLT